MEGAFSETHFVNSCYNIEERHHTICKSYANVSKEEMNCFYKNEEDSVKKSDQNSYKRNKAQTSIGKYWIVPGFYEDITQIIMYFQKHEKFNFYSVDYVFHLLNQKTCIKKTNIFS